MPTSSPDVRTRLLAVMPRLRRFMFVFAGSLASADELLAEMCEHIVAEHCGRLPDENADQWLFTLATMLVEQKLASKQPGPSGPAMRSSHAVGLQNGSDGWSGYEQSAFHAVLELPLEQRIILALVCIEGFSYSEAASILGIPSETLTKSLIEARLVLAKEVSSERGCARRAIANGRLVNSPIGQSDRRSASEGSSVSTPLPGASEVGPFVWGQAQQ